MGIIKSVLNKLGYIKKEPILNDEDRQKSLETRRLQHQINQLEKQMAMKAHLNELTNGLNQTSKQSSEEMFMNLITTYLMNNTSNNTQNLNTQTTISTFSKDNTGKNPILTPLEVKEIANKLKPYTLNFKDKIAALTNDDIIAIKEEIIK